MSRQARRYSRTVTNTDGKMPASCKINEPGTVLGPGSRFLIIVRSGRNARRTEVA